MLRGYHRLEPVLEEQPEAEIHLRENAAIQRKRDRHRVARDRARHAHAHDPRAIRRALALHRVGIAERLQLVSERIEAPREALEARGHVHRVADRGVLRTLGRPDVADDCLARVNADTDLRLAFRRGIEEVWSHGDQQLEKALSRGREYMAEAAAAKMTAYGCAGRAHATLVGTGVAGRKW